MIESTSSRLCARCSLALTIAVCLLPRSGSAELLANDAPKPPKLVVQITVDQLRGDLPMRYRERLPKGGFRYLLEEGAHYVNAHYRHANTETAVGHATLVTGADPSRHGIVGNDWIDPKTGAFIYNTEDERHHLIGKKARAHRGVSPRNLLGSTIGDELVLSNAGKSRVFSVSGKDRGAILPGGHAGKAYWYSKSSGEFVTSTYYYDSYPEWVRAWNAGKPADRYRGKKWELLQPRENYVAKDIDDRPYMITPPRVGALRCPDMCPRVGHYLPLPNCHTVSIFFAMQS